AGGDPLLDGNIMNFVGVVPAGRWRLVFGRLRINAGIVTVEAGQQNALVADVQDAFAFLAADEKSLVFWLQASRTRRTKAAVIPGHAHLAMIAAGRKRQV